MNPIPEKRSLVPKEHSSPSKRPRTSLPNEIPTTIDLMSNDEGVNSIRHPHDQSVARSDRPSDLPFTIDLTTDLVNKATGQDRGDVEKGEHGNNMKPVPQLQSDTKPSASSASKSGPITVESKAPPENKEKKNEGEDEEGGEEGGRPEDEDVFDIAAIRKHEYNIVSKLSPAQMQRYEQYRRSDLKKEKVKKVIAALHPSLVKAGDPFLIVVKGLAKVFVGDVVESALEVQRQWGDGGALQPKHIREAYRLLRRDGAIPLPGGARSLL